MDWLLVLFDGPIAKTFLFVLAIVGFAGWAIDRRRKDPERHPRYLLTSFNVVGHPTVALPGLEIFYNGQSIKVMYSTTVKLWNTGSIPIDKEDLETINPLSFSVEGDGYVLDKYPIRSTSASVNPILTVSDDKKRVFVNFDYLNQGHGLEFVVLHTGSKDATFDLKGDIRGVNEIERVKLGVNEHRASRIIDRFASIAPGIAGFFGIATVLFGLTSDIPLLAPLIISVVGSSIVLFHFRRMQMYSRMIAPDLPKELEG